MKIRIVHGVMIALTIGAAFSLPAPTPDDAEAQTGAVKRIAGYLYTTTNGEGINKVIRLARYEDCTIGTTRRPTLLTSEAARTTTHPR